MKRILIRSTALFTFLWLVTACLPSGKNNTSLTENWIAEDESAAMQLSLVSDTLDIVVPAGLTLWYNEPLTGEYEISYHIAMLMEDGKQDRLSDLNCFWAANDPQYPDDIFARSEWRNGVFKNYNTLNLFYVGYYNVGRSIIILLFNPIYSYTNLYYLVSSVF